MIYFKRFIKITSFLLGLIVLLLIPSQILKPKNNTKEAGIENPSANGILGEAPNTVDIVFIGDSEAYSAFTPMQIWKEAGYTSHICATGAQTLDYTYLMLQRAFENQSPKLVVMETNIFFRKLAVWRKVTTKLNSTFSVFMYHDLWKQFDIDELSVPPQYKATDYKKGFWFDNTIESAIPTDYMAPNGKIAKISALNVDQITQIKNFCEERGAELLLVSAPSMINWNIAKHNATADFAKELGCEFIDYNLMNDEIGIDWTTDTRDKGDHVNYYGAVKVTRHLTGYLQERGIFEDHREDPKYKQWHNDYKIYQYVLKSWEKKK